MVNALLAFRSHDPEVQEELDVNLRLPLPEGDEPNPDVTHGRTALMVAAVDGHVDVVRALAAAPGIDLEVESQERGYDLGLTALGLAAVKGDLPVVQALIQAGALIKNTIFVLVVLVPFNSFQ